MNTPPGPGWVMKGDEEEVCKISVDDSYEGVGLGEGEACGTPSPEEFEPEETYIIPNPVVGTDSTEGETGGQYREGS